ncbi:hypothetical protein BDW74DRAFT_11213 [Aspergillus multicolor]|uniref:uncharacterized protein n=1 Tax=Aspergillus multicolor TaxID=41759 RepID=UPI003CCE3397
MWGDNYRPGTAHSTTMRYPSSTLIFRFSLVFPVSQSALGRTLPFSFLLVALNQGRLYLSHFAKSQGRDTSITRCLYRNAALVR